MIDPEIWTDEKVLKLTWTAIPFYVGLITQADDEGRIRYDATSLRAKIAPRDEVTTEHVEVWMWECVEVGLVLVYESEGVLFAFLPGWMDYQKVQHPSPSRLPEPPANTKEVSRDLLEDYRNAHESSRILMNFREDYRNAHPRLDQVRLDRSGGVRGARTRQTPPQTSPDEFERFGEIEPDVVLYVALAAEENKSKRITANREASIRRELKTIADTLPRPIFAEALREAVRHAAPNANYVKRVAESIQRRSDRGGLAVVPSSKSIHAYADGRKVEFIRGTADEPKSWTDTPPRGLKRSEVWPEHQHLVFGGDEDAA
jgi:hypothetical protein